MKNAGFVVIGLLATATFADLTPTTILDNVPGDTTISNLVSASGVSTGGVKPEAVRDIVQPMLDEAIEANEKTGTNQQIVRGNLTNTRWSIDVESSSIADTAEYANYIRVGYWTDDADATGKPTTISGYGITDARGRDDNICHKTEFTDFSAEDGAPDDLIGQPHSVRIHEYDDICDWDWESSTLGFFYSLGISESTLTLDFVSSDGSMRFTATRQRIATHGQPFTTFDVVTNEVATAISTNNPSFVSAVRDTPAPEPGQGEDPPWGTWGTVGAAIAGLVAALKLTVKKIKCGTMPEITPTSGVADLSDFFSESNSLLMGTIRYSHYAVPTGGALKDRAINAFTFSGDSLPDFPAQVSGYARDFLLDVTATAAASNLTLPESGATSIGDALAFEASHTYLVAVTEIAAKKYYIRVIDTTPTNA